MKEQHRISAGERATHKYNRRRADRDKEVEALKAMTVKTLMKKMGVSRLFQESRTWHKIVAILTARDKRLQKLGVRVLKPRAAK